MNQHPIPQNVTGYQFRLIGDMTIQQFIYLSVGIGAAIFFYYTNLFSLIKWFFVLVSAIAGFAVAFLPFEERSLDQWLVNYIKAIYRSTRFTWQKTPPAPEYFSFSSNPSAAPNDAEELARAATIRRQQGLHSFLVSLPNDQEAAIDLQEKSSLSGYLNLFTNSAAPAAPITPPPPEILSPPVQEIVMEPSPSTAPTVAAVTSSSLPFPSAPATPNTVVGMVLDNNERIVDNAIVEIVDDTGLPVRATKTNQLGQFFSTTPLRRGTYRLTVEKNGFSFDTIELVLSGQVVAPLKIQAKPPTQG